MNHKLSRLYAHDIRQARVAKGWSRKKLAREMRVPWILVQQWEEGSEPETRYALRLYVLLGVRVMPVITIQPRAPRVQKVQEPTVPVISWTPTVGKF